MTIVSRSLRCFRPWAIALGLCAISSLGVASEKSAWTGTILFSSQGKILAFNLETGKHETIYRVQPLDQPGYHVSVSLSRGEDRTVFFDRHRWETAASPERWDIHRLDLRTGNEEFIRRGRAPTFIPEHRKLFFYDLRSDGTGARGLYLFVAPVADPVNAAVQLLPERFVSANRLIQVSPDEVVFRLEQAHKPSTVMLYNLANGTVRALEINNCYPALWREATKRLLCWHENYERDRHFFTDLESRHVERGIMPHGNNPVYYVKRLDLAISGAAGGFLKNTYQLAVFDFKTRRTTILLKNYGPHDGGAIWIE